MLKSVSNFFLQHLIEKYKRERSRRYQRSYLKAKKNNTVVCVYKVKQVLSDTVCTEDASFSKFYFGSAIKVAELSVRQFLLRSIVENRINRPLILVLGDEKKTVLHPLPRKWRVALKDEGFNVPAKQNALLFQTYVWIRFFSGIFNIIRFITGNIASLLAGKKESKGKYVFFDALSEKNLPVAGSTGVSYDIFSWYLQWEGRANAIDSLVHTASQSCKIDVNGVELMYVPSAIRPLDNLYQLMRFLEWSIKAVLLSLWGLAIGRWWYALLLSEASKAAITRIQKKTKLAETYLFHNALWIYRPLWTYEAEHKGSEVLFYFYSTNITFIKTQEGYQAPNIGWKTATWSNYLVWDKYQRLFLNQTLRQSANILEVGPIWFNSGAYLSKALPKNAVSVFDVQPVRDSFYRSLAFAVDYYTPETANAFLEDIYKELEENSIIMVHKRKREAGSLLHYRYRNLLKKLSVKKNYLSVDPALAPQVLIKDSIAVLSMPFTSTALIARDMGKPSAYYDPMGLIQKDDISSHNIPVLTGKKELKEWIKRLIQVANND